MNRTQSLIVHVLAIGLVAVNLLGTSDVRAARLTVTPDTLPNDYKGVVTLEIAGLTNGQAVTDGQARSIGGVRNPNVPGDDDETANGLFGWQERLCRVWLRA